VGFSALSCNRGFSEFPTSRGDLAKSTTINAFSLQNIFDKKFLNNNEKHLLKKYIIITTYQPQIKPVDHFNFLTQADQLTSKNNKGK